MAKTDINKLCADFSEAVRKNGTALPTVYDGERWEEGGFRSESNTHQLKTAGFTAEYTKTSTTSWNVCNDNYRQHETLSITFGAKSKFSAFHALGGRTECFGAGESYSGSQSVKADEWDVSGAGAIKLMQNYLKSLQA